MGFFRASQLTRGLPATSHPEIITISRGFPAPSVILFFADLPGTHDSSALSGNWRS